MTQSERDASTFAAAPRELDLPRLEEGILAFWDAHDIEGQSLRLGADAASGRTNLPAFVFYDGPPFATGLPHYGHILPGTIKDIVPRYQSMRGLAVERRFGWDCHGLPIESLTEDELGVHGKAEIEALGIDAFNRACRTGVLRYTAQWRKTMRRLARWVDFDNDYKTMDTGFMQSVWWVFRTLWDKGMVYEGHRVQPVSPALGTPLSNFEVAQGPQEKDPVTRKEGHKRRQDPSLTIRFALEDEDASLWAWTTTPWTLPSNLALAVHPALDYVKIRVKDTGEVAYLEPSRLADYQAKGKLGEVEVLATMPGTALVGRPYTPLFPYFAQLRERDGKRLAFRVVAAEYVSTDAGTGIVHQAPAFGEEDYEVGRREGLPLVNPVSLQGIFDARVTDFAGQYVKDADKGIAAMLKAQGKLVDQDVIVHPYPHCYRTEQPLLYMALSTWFVRVEPIRQRLVDHNDAIHWVPDHVGSGRFGNWLGGARDWNVARSRYWGTPIPIWRCDTDPEDVVCVGSIAELAELCGRPVESLTDLHRESVDAITFPSRKTPGGTMRRIPDVFDCWFESGSMPYAQNHYPFDASKREYVERNLPADFIAEGLDQTRGWFYTLHVLATALFDRPAFKHVIVNGLVLAEDGKKMSKRLKNYPDPTVVIDQYGADSLRAYLVSSAAVRGEPMRFSERGVRDTVRTVILPLYNAYNFLVTYARADGWSPTPAELDDAAGFERPPGKLDRWILSRVVAFVDELQREFDAYALSNAVPALTRICDDLNNWYIRRGRRRYWRARGGEAGDRDKHFAYATLFRVLVSVTKAIAPVIPFVTEWLFQRMVVDTGLVPPGTSVHLSRWPALPASLRDEALEREVAAVRAAVGLGLAVREREKLPVRRPLPGVTIASPDAGVRAAVSSMQDDLLGELNVKQLEVAADDSALCKVTVKANFKLLGKRLGARMKEVGAAIAALDAAAIARLHADGAIVLDGERIAFDEVLVTREVLGGRAAEVGEGMTVVLDTAVTPELRREGLARELVNRVQNLRKDAGLEVSQRIALVVSTDGDLASVLGDANLRELVAAEVLAVSVEVVAPGTVEAGGHVASDEIDGVPVALAIAVAAD
ncbi:MAG: isoleucine--tRNA ligase [Nannocystaceae bacterium]|nr:isoleucine--tRNA ligase [Nannocystaceae bacterium]